MPLPDPHALASVRAALDAVCRHAADGEEEALAVLAVVGEPSAQRALDDWVDQLTDTMRAIAAAAEHHRDAIDEVGAGDPADRADRTSRADRESRADRAGPSDCAVARAPSAEETWR